MVHVLLMMLQRCVCDWADLACVFLCHLRMVRRQVCRHRTDYRACCVCDGLVGVDVLESWAHRGVHGFFLVVWDRWGGGVVVDDIVVVRDLMPHLLVEIARK